MIRIQIGGEPQAGVIGLSFGSNRLQDTGAAINRDVIHPKAPYHVQKEPLLRLIEWARGEQMEALAEHLEAELEYFEKEIHDRALAAANRANETKMILDDWKGAA